MVTGAIFKGLTFDGIDSKQYGVYITGEAVYNSPSRDVEMIEIPGRNGSYALDKGRFNNIEVTYPAGIFGRDESEFAQVISDFRNAIASRKGYCRLTDDYNTNEYRMGVYMSGLEVTPTMLKAGQFEITFNCKPQRFLTSGETEQTVTNSITNPTLFDSHPLLMTYGYGDININEDKITIGNDSVGEVIINWDWQSIASDTYTLILDALNVGDSFVVKWSPSTFNYGNDVYRMVLAREPSNHTFEGTFTNLVEAHCKSYVQFYNETYNPRVVFCYSPDDITLVKGTPNTTSAYYTGDVHINYVVGTQDYEEVFSIRYNISIAYDGDDSLTISTNLEYTGGGLTRITGRYPSLYLIKGESTKSALGDPTYIDLDIGECYKVDGIVINVNNNVQLPAELPVLKPGANAITKSITLRTLIIVPRWWKV